MSNVSLETLVSLAKRRGFVWQASEIYGGLAGFYNWGPYGTEVIKNIRQAWWKAFVYDQPNVVGLDSAIIQHAKLWQASGHVATFHDPLVECKHCHYRFREDQKEAGKCPNCGKKGPFTKSRHFNLMFRTNVGPLADDSSVSYLRPETAGGIFTDYELVRETTRQKIPFGIAQIGKAFRNEISPRDWLFRVREFEQAELEYFVHPKQANKEFTRWLKFCKDWLKSIGIDQKKIKDNVLSAKERAHYAAKNVDIQYQYPFGFKELWGVAYRTDYDLSAHQKASGKDLSYFDETTGDKFVPHVIEPSLGLDRLFFALLDSAYHEESVRGLPAGRQGEKRVVLRFKPDIAPVKVAVLPLSKHAKLSPLARKVWSQISGEFRTEYDETQSIGRRYRRQDEIGTPFCVTVDFDSLKDKAVTIRDRDSMRQTRVKVKELNQTLAKKLT
ncbi:glycine--tRNA ligase [Candidatus Microgenomates bacterium]|nr:glycine--tRNA ligase [Candidatus Microgenomates bacterium]